MNAQHPTGTSTCAPPEIPDDLLPTLLITAAREVTCRADNLAHADEDAVESLAMEQRIQKLEVAIAAWRDVVNGAPLAQSSILFLAEQEILWEAGDDSVSMPVTVAELDAMQDRLERQRFLIQVRDRGGVA